MTRKVFFYFVSLSIPVLFFSLLELGLYIFKYGQEPPQLFIQDSIDRSYLVMNPDVAKRYFSTPEFAPSGAYDVFRKVKTDSTFRIFVQGASSSGGFPYRGASFPRLLEQKLQFYYPKLDVEVVNTSLVATNSYAILDLSNEIISHEPDMVIIYGGHNEFYGAFGVGSSQSLGGSIIVTNIYLKLKNVRTVQLLRNIVKIFNTQRVDEVNRQTLMAKMVKNGNISLDSKIYQAGLNQYEFNITRAIKNYKLNNVPVYLSSLVSNLKDFKPFESSSDSESAYAYYDMGQNLLASGQIDQAKEALNMARDKDLLKFRATSDILGIIDSICLQYGVPQIDMEAAFSEASLFGIIGDELLLEHVHANLNGQILFAETAFVSVKELLRTKGIEPGNRPGFQYAIAAIDSILGYQVINRLLQSWPFEDQPKDRTLTFKILDQLTSGQVSWLQILSTNFYENIQSNPLEALNVARVIQQEYPHQKQPYLFIIQALINSNQFDEAESLMRTIPEKFNGIEVKEMLLQIKLKTFNYEEALDAVDKVLADKSDIHNNKVKESLINLQTINYKDINNKDVLSNSEGYVNALEALIFLQNMEEAKELNEKLLKLIPQNESLKRVKKRGVF